MPYPNEHAARVHDPGQYDRFTRKSIDDGVDIILGWKGSKSEVQAYRFKSSKFSAAEAKAWLKDHEVEYVSFEEAAGKENAGATPSFRALNINLGIPKLVHGPDGSLTVKDVPVLAVGNWHASNARNPIYYSREVLKRDVKNWVSRGIWARHQGLTPRNITEMIGEVRHEHFANDAVTADLFYHGKTQMSRDVIEMITLGLTAAVSVEHGGEEIWNADAKRYDAASLTFYGMANVDMGACDVCKIKLNAAGEVDDCEPQNGRDTTSEGSDMDNEADKKLAESEAKVKTLEASTAKALEEATRNKATEEATAKKLAEFEAKTVELSKALEDARKEIEVMKKDPVIKSLASSEASKLDDQAEVTPPRIMVQNGMVYRA